MILIFGLFLGVFSVSLHSTAGMYYRKNGLSLFGSPEAVPAALSERVYSGLRQEAAKRDINLPTEKQPFEIYDQNIEIVAGFRVGFDQKTVEYIFSVVDSKTQQTFLFKVIVKWKGYFKNHLRSFGIVSDLISDEIDGTCDLVEIKFSGESFTSRLKSSLGF